MPRIITFSTVIRANAGASAIQVFFSCSLFVQLPVACPSVSKVFFILARLVAADRLPYIRFLYSLLYVSILWNQGRRVIFCDARF